MCYYYIRQTQTQTLCVVCCVCVVGCGNYAYTNPPFLEDPVWRGAGKLAGVQEKARSGPRSQCWTRCRFENETVYIYTILYYILQNRNCVVFIVIVWGGNYTYKSSVSVSGYLEDPVLRRRRGTHTIKSQRARGDKGIVRGDDFKLYIYIYICRFDEMTDSRQIFIR